MAYKCTDAESIYQDLPFCQGQKSLPGVRQYCFGISKRDIILWPTLKGAAALTLKEVASYVGDFVLVADKKWHKVGLVDNQNDIVSESQGSDGSKSFKNTGTAVIPGTEEEATGYIAKANNDDMVYLFVQRNGKARVIGNEAFRTELTLSQNTGKAVTDTNSTTVQAVCTDEYPAPFYPGKIETADGNFSGETGLVITDVLP